MQSTGTSVSNEIRGMVWTCCMGAQRVVRYAVMDLMRQGRLQKIAERTQFADEPARERANGQQPKQPWKRPIMVNSRRQPRRMMNTHMPMSRKMLVGEIVWPCCVARAGLALTGGTGAGAGALMALQRYLQTAGYSAP